MYARLDDELIDHTKVFLAGQRLGPDGPAIALGFYALLIMWSNRHLSDGQIPIVTLTNFRHVRRPLAVAEALVHAGLLEASEGGFRIHDFGDHNPSAREIKAKRQADRNRKRAERARLTGQES
jgi:hypothetical protein